MDIDLNNPEKIDLTMRTQEGEVETLYWKLEDFLYKGQIDDAKTFFEMFVYMAKHRKSLLAKTLKPIHLNRLKEISQEIDGGSITKKYESIKIKMATSARSLPFKSEKELNEHLCDNAEVLSRALGDKIIRTRSEVQTDCEYRCDIVAESKNKFYPIELKMRQATHAVVSQIHKYCFYFYRQLRYGMYKDIQGVTISNGFDDWSINELRKTGIRIFEMVPESKSISLREIQ